MLCLHRRRGSLDENAHEVVARRSRVTALSWSPDGQLLAAAAEDTLGFMVWDVTLGRGTLLRSGAQGMRGQLLWLLLVHFNCMLLQVPNVT